MMKKVLRVMAAAACLPALFFASTGVREPALEFEFDHLSIKHGLAQSGVSDILQDRKGFMWFATQDGLNKYDGVTFTLYQNIARDPRSISHDWIFCLYEGLQGRLWIGTNGGGLNMFDPETETFTRYIHGPDNPKGISSNFIRDICQDQGGKLWIATAAGLNRLDPETGKVKRFPADPANPGALPHDIVYSMCIAPDGAIWMGHRGGFSRLEPGKERFVNYKRMPGDAKGLSSDYVLAVYVDEDGSVWLGANEHGLDKFDPATQTFTHYSTTSDVGSVASPISTVVRDRTGLVWMGTHLNGLIVLDPEANKSRHFKHTAGEPGKLSWNSIRSIYEDRSGMIWIGTAGAGINKADRYKKKFDSFKRKPGSPEHFALYSLHAIYEDPDGILWLASSYGGLNRLDRGAGAMTHHPCQPEGKGGGAVYIRAIVGDPNKNLWLGTFGRGVCKYDPASKLFQPYLPDPDNIDGNYVKTLIRARDGSLFVGLEFGRFYRFDPASGAFTRFRHDPDSARTLRSYSIRALYEDRAGDIWIGTSSRGMLKFNRGPKSFTRYKAEAGNLNSLNDNDIHAIVEDAAGALWIGTSGGGLNSFDRASGTFNHYTTRDGLANNVVYGILEDENGFLWLSTNKGICRFDPAAKEFKNYDIRDGLQGYEFNGGAYYKSRSGEMFFGGIDGLNMFFPGRIKTNLHKPPIVLTGFKLFHRSVPVGGGSPLQKHISYTRDVSLSYKDNTLSFEFAALDYTDPARNQYKYKVEGLHEDWIYLGYENRVSLAVLEPGEYVLHVKGSNNDGVWNESGASITFRIRPPFWKTWWFRVLVLLTAAGLAVHWHRRRMNLATLQLKTEAQMNRLFAKYGISEREQEVLHLVLKGKSNQDIEDELYISVRTVKKHIYAIYRKMGVRNRLELINFIQRALPKQYPGHTAT
jgi:ligand-binding sensor domain-containing protein/DNA-binding CsgD family transcriptional regulator